jgi:hypothetical protein
MARFPDSRIAAARWSSQACSPVTSGNAPLTAYSGGTVWALHPLRMAAGVNVRLSTHADVTCVVSGLQPDRGSIYLKQRTELPEVRIFT